MSVRLADGCITASMDKAGRGKLQRFLHVQSNRPAEIHNQLEVEYVERSAPQNSTH